MPLETVQEIEDELAPAEAAKAHGVALIKAGHSVRYAANEVDIPRSTLHDAYLKVLGPGAPDAAQRVAHTGDSS